MSPHDETINFLLKIEHEKKYKEKCESKDPCGTPQSNGAEEDEQGQSTKATLMNIYYTFLDILVVS